MKQYKEFNTSPVNSSFFVVNHELAVPDGIEGPIPVYMKPDAYDKTEMAITTNGSPDLTPTFATEDQTVSTIQIENEEPVQVFLYTFQTFLIIPNDLRIICQITKN